MEFFLFLNENTQQLVKFISKANYKISENSGICYHHLVTGFIQYPQKLFTVCTDNIKNTSYNVRYDVNRVVTHEAMHVAQMCNRNRPLGLQKSSLTIEKYQRIERSLAIGSNMNYDAEYEAYMMEDNPKQVAEYLKTFCF